MDLLSIATKSRNDNIISMLDGYLDLFKKEDLYIDRSSYLLGDTFFIDYELNEKTSKGYDNVTNIFKHYIANGIADLILGVYQNQIIDRILATKYSYFDKFEREKIKANTTDYLKKNEYITTEGIIYKISKKARILKIVLEFLDFNNEINIEGFIKFRLRFYIDIIEDAIDKNIEDFLVEREFKEFIKILQYFVEIQEPKIDVVNVLLKDKKYELLDGKNTVINNDFLEEIADELSDIDINYDDLLISSLITIAPRKIIIHVDESSYRNDIIDIIKNVFSNKVTICNGCKLCGFDTNIKGHLNEEK